MKLYTKLLKIGGKKSMKKIVCLLVALFVLAGIMAGCAAETPSAPQEAPSSSQPAAAPSEAAAPESPTASASESASPAGKTGVFAYPLYGGGVPKDLKVGYSELSIADPWRVAQVASMQEEATKRGVNYIMTDAQNKQDKQLSDLEDLMSQGCNFIFLSPLNMDGFQSAVDEAKQKQIPIICIDREITGTPGMDVVSTVLADFITQGVNCADWLDKNIQGDLKVVQITGQPGGSDVRDRTKGFADSMAKINAAGHKMEIVSSQNGQWSRTETQKLMQNIIQSLGKDGFNAVYAQNDEMAMGAVLAMKAAGIKVGEGGVAVVTVDGQKQAVQYVINGEISCISTCTPLFGPAAFKAMDDYLAGKEMPPIIYNQEKIITKENAAEEIKVAWGN
jgi:ribose transport system substrate-binding protein